jgi:flagellar biosynthesis anti-sigma factor FlgM
MKVPGTDAADIKIGRTQDARVGDQTLIRRPQAADDKGVAGALAPTGAPGDTVKVSPLAALLQSELNPSKMEEERRQKVAALKERVQNGTYSVDSQSVARSLIDELDMESRTAPDFKD